MLKIVTDGAADMPADWGACYEINVLPLNVNFGRETYTQGDGFTREDFYRMVRETKKIPKTSLPSIGQVKAFYHSIAEAGDTILSIHISGKLSGTFATIQSAASELTDAFKIITFDSGGGSAAQAFMAREARMMDNAGASVSEIIQRLETIRRNLTILFTLDTLEFAYLSGRINALQNLIVTALQVKPIIVLREGMLEMGEKVRTRHRALDCVLDSLKQRVGEKMINVAVVHAADEPTAKNMLERTNSMFNVRDSFVLDLSIPVAAHLGPGAIGVVAYPVEEER
jgi:DegV family protein with EDD domain